MSARRVILNADDLGLARCVNRGIERAHTDGILTSATLLANGSAFDDGVAIAKRNPALGIGVHLNLVRGKPVAPSETVAALLGESGYFRHKPLPDDGKYLVAAAVEYRAQIARIVDAGITPTHIDFEKHHARHPHLYGLAARIAKEFGIDAIRTLVEPVAFAFRRLPGAEKRALVRSAMLRTLLTIRPLKVPDLKHPDGFLGQTHIGKINREFLLGVARHCPDGTFEIMTHPGEYDEAEMDALHDEIGESWIHPLRPDETEALTDPMIAAAFSEYGIERVTFAAL